jgi:predicted aldo/keto reductase-like oxidoreductase
MASALDYVEASAEEREHEGIVDGILQAFAGHCVYCNHCLPCPANIPIGSVLQAADWAKAGPKVEMQEWYATLEARASDCIACADCTERCPFGVDVIAKMEQAVEVFGA